MGLLAVAAAAADLDGAPRFSVLTVDHGLRPDAAAEAGLVAAACAEAGLPHHILPADVPICGGDVQQKARQVRYRLMGDWCAANGAEALAAAHHLDDQAETVLMRLARGSDINGLCGMAPSRRPVLAGAGPVLLRPFLDRRGAGLKNLAKQAGFQTAADPSNADRRFERVRWRQALPQLSQCGLSAPALAALAQDMQRLRQAMDARLAAWLAEHGTWHDYGVLCLDRAAYLTLDASLQRRLMAAFVRHFGGAAHPAKQARLAAFAARPAGKAAGAATLGGAHLRWRSKTVFLGREAAAAPCTAVSATPQIWDNRFRVSAARQGPNVAPLGADGVAAVKAAGGVFDTAVPAAYHAALPGFFDGDRLSACAPVQPVTGFAAAGVFSDSLFRDILSNGQDW